MTMTQAERMKRWRQRNPDTSKAGCRTYHAQNAERVRARKAAYYQQVRKALDASDDGKMKDRNRKARRRAATKSGNVTPDQWAGICHVYNFACAYCARSDLPLEMDHVKPLARGGEHTATNIAPACKPCNSRKGAR